MGEQNYNNFVSQIQKIDKNYFCGKCARMGVSTEATQKCPKCHCLCDNCIHNHDCDTKSFAFGYGRKYLLVRNYKRVDTENYEMEIIPCEAEKPNHLNTYFLNRDKLVIMFNDFVVEFDKNEDYSFDRFVWNKVFKEEYENIVKNICNSCFLKSEECEMEGYSLFLQTLQVLQRCR
jgi:hypothetical protein